MNRSQLEQCIAEHGKEIYAFCRHLVGYTIEADELYQDTFLKAVEMLDIIEYERNPKSYLISIALRLWNNKRRKYAWRKRIAGTEELCEENTEDAATGNLLEEEVVREELNRIVRKAVAGLDDKYRVPIYLFYTEQMKVEEISRVLKLPQGTVKTRLFKARKMLKKELEVVLDEV